MNRPARMLSMLAGILTSLLLFQDLSLAARKVELALRRCWLSADGRPTASKLTSRSFPARSPYEDAFAHHGIFKN